MLFNSPDFLFAFLPAFLLVYFFSKDRVRNTILFAASILFYYVTSAELTVILLLSVVVNYFAAWWIFNSEGTKRKTRLVIAVILNLTPLIYYKYAVFFTGAVGDVFSIFGWNYAKLNINPPLPIGISFFTFQALSYVSDVYLKRVVPARSLIDFGMYHSCFPQLIAGPIVRYEEIESEVHRREHKLDDIFNGVVQFGFGLGKKVILADPVGIVADRIFGSTPGIDFIASWAGLLAYTLQIYLDFSAYSDMAIGLGRILGFHYPENFNQPYRSSSVTEFWRRWHMSLSRWFRDYVYIPLGGNRDGHMATLRNLVLVFFLCGLWHGAAWTFVIWGLYHGVLLLLERLLRRWTSYRPPVLAGWFYTLFVVMLGWVFFRSKSLHDAAHYFSAMVGARGMDPHSQLIVSTLQHDKLVYMAAGLLVALVPYSWVTGRLERGYEFNDAHALASIAILMMAIIMMSAGGFTPFIYFRF